MTTHTITRRIEIDAGHRVPHHESKCANLHGHRYVIEATCKGARATDGEQTGMVLDFGFLKQAMMEHIHEPCDHRFIFAVWDKVCFDLFFGTMPRLKPAMLEEIRTSRHQAGSFTGASGQLFYVTNFSPTAENLARHWFHRLAPDVVQLSNNRAWLTRMRVHETPNCFADYSE